jgi:16S rRNA processing protein RimM
MAPAKHVVVAEVVKPHGLRGEVVLASHAESDELFGEMEWVRLEPPSGDLRQARRLEIEHWRRHKGRVLLKLRGLDGRDQAELWRGAAVTVPASELPETDEDDVRLHEILGCQVLLHDGAPLGVLEQFAMHGGQEVWSIMTPDGCEVLLPACPEFVAAIDLDARRITVDPPPGLLELYLDQGESA